MNSDNLIDTVKSAVAYAELCAHWLAYAGLGFASVFVAIAVDRLEPAPYAAYYVGAVNAAISPKYWDLLSVTSLMLLCGVPPLRLLRQQPSAWAVVSDGLCRVTRQILAVTFSLGAVSAGILAALLVCGQSNGAALLAWSELLFGSHPVIALLLLVVFNSLLGAAGLALAQPEHPWWQRVLAQPRRYRWSFYALFVGAVVVLVAGQQ